MSDELISVRVLAEAVNAQAQDRLHPARRQSSIDEEAVRRLEKQLEHRPEKTELVDRNILKGAPTFLFVVHA